MATRSHRAAACFALLAALLFAAGSARADRATTAAEPAGASASAPRGRLARLWAKLGVTVSAGVVAGVPGLDGGVRLGAQHREEDAPHHGGLFGMVSGHLGPFGLAETASPNPQMRGREVSLSALATVGRDNPVYGDRASITVVPGVFSLTASRKGGLGISLAAFPLPFAEPLFPFVRGEISVYVAHPRLSKPANWVLDHVDRLQGKLDQLGDRIRRIVRRRRTRDSPRLPRLRQPRPAALRDIASYRARRQRHRESWLMPRGRKAASEIAGR